MTTIAGGAKADDEDRWSQMMAAAHRGDAKAYERLLRELGDVIERFVRQRFGPLSFVEDCVQECLLAIHNGRHTYDPRRPFRPWMFTIVRNRTIDLLRRSYAGPTVSDDVDHELVATTHGADADAFVGELLAQLPPRHRDALALTKLHGYTLSEAAERSGISVSAMKSRVSRAIRAAEDLLYQESSRE